MEYVCIFNAHLNYFKARWYKLWPFGIVCGDLVYLVPFWYVWTKKNLATLDSNPSLLLEPTLLHHREIRHHVNERILTFALLHIASRYSDQAVMIMCVHDVTEK
jgi:hypothetical protein